MEKLMDNIFITKVDEGCFALWNSRSLSVAFFRGNLNELKRLSETDNCLDESESRRELMHFFDSKDITREAYENDVNICQMVLLVTTKCNYDCRYCQIEKNMLNSKALDMPLEVAEKALRIFEKNTDTKGRKTLTITGGEPLLNWLVVEKTIEKTRALLPDTRIVIFTNASLVTPEIAEFLHDNDVNVLVSFDGDSDIHDVNRVDKFGCGTFEKSMEGYKLLKTAGCNVAISSVGGIHNYDKIPQLVDFYKKCMPKSVGYNIPHCLLNQENGIDISYEILAKSMIDLYEGLRKEGIYLENISRIINSFSGKRVRVHECQAQGRGFTVDPRGKIGPCKSLVINDIVSIPMAEEIIIKDIPVFSNWAERSPLRTDECSMCPAVGLCGGGCAYDSYVRYNGNFQHMDESVCGFTQVILKYLIQEMYLRLKDQIGESLYVVSDEQQRVIFEQYRDLKSQLHTSVGHD